MRILQPFIRFQQKQPINIVDLTIFFRQFATLLSSGLPITQACEMLEKSQTKIALRLLIYTIKRDILSGQRLFHCLQSHPNYFDDFICHLIKIGDETGKLDMILTHIADLKEKQLALHKKLKRSCFYPGIVLLFSLCIVILMLVFVVPKFKTIFQNTSSELPRISVFIFWLSEVVPYVLAIVCLLIMASCLMLRSTMKKYFSYLFHHLPVIKTIHQKILWSRFATQLSLTLSAGIAITDALLLTANACGDQAFAKHIKTLQMNILQGQPLYSAMQTLMCFPPLMIQMVKVGESSGTLETMLHKIAQFLEADIDQLTNYLTQVLEPLIMLILGVLIGGVVIGMYLPIFNLSNGL